MEVTSPINLTTSEISHDLNTTQNREQLITVTERGSQCKRKSRKPKKIFIPHHGLNTFNKESVKCHDIGQMAYKFSGCGAVMFKDEKSDSSPSANNPNVKFSLCCSYGNVKLPPIKEPLEKLKHLLTGNTQRDRDFQTNI